MEGKDDTILTHKDIQYKRMYERMEANYTSKSYILPEWEEQYKNNYLTVNFNALMTVLNIYSKVYEDMINMANGLIESKQQKSLKKNLREFYGQGASLYLVDLLVWTSMIQSRDQIHYKPLENEEWQLVLKHYEKMSLGSDE